MSTSSRLRRARPTRWLGVASSAALVALLLVSAPSASSVAAAAPAPATSAARPGQDVARPARPASARVAFDLVNTNNSTVACLSLPDAKAYRVRGRLIGPSAVLEGRDVASSVNVLVHDAGTGGWFFNLRSNPTYDYATRLAAQGQTSLVLDRLGYGQSPLRDGRATCLGAQVHMLHQVVQQLYSGRFDYVGASTPDAQPPHFTQIVLQGHGTGATIAQLEAARFDDVAALVLMAPATTSPSQLALNTLRDQARDCASASFAAYGSSARDYRRLLFRTAPRSVQKAAVARRNPTPCGDVSSLPSALASATLSDGDVEVPVLVLRAGADARTSGTTAITSTEPVTRRTIKGAGSALTLEKSAPETRRLVLRWLATV